MVLGIQFNFEVNDMVSGALEGVKAQFDKAFDNDKTLAKFNAGLGQSAEVTARMGDLAREVFTEGWGESLEDVTNALGEVGSQMLDLSNSSPDEIRKITQGALDLAEVMGVDVVEVTRAAGNMMKNGLAPDAQTALDIIATGAQNGANRAGDLLDVFGEYSGSFAKVGLDGHTALMMIKNSLDSGAYTADIAADSIREFGIIVMEGGDSASAALQGMDFDLATVQATLAKGGPAAAQMTEDIIYSLGEISDPLARQQAGAALFGSMWTDAGEDMVLSMTLSDTAMGTLNGATEKMGQTLHNVATQKVDKLKRSFDGWVQSMIATDGPFGTVAAFAMTFGPQALTVAGNVGLIAMAFKGTAVAAGIARGAMGLFALAAAPLAIIAAAIGSIVILINTAIQRVDVLKTNLQGLVTGNLSKISSFGTFDNLGRRGGANGGFGLPFMATGGIVTRPTLAMIGEGGESEAVIPLSRLGDMTGGQGGSITINVPGGFVGNYDELATKIRDIIVTGQRRGVIDGQWHG